MLKNKHKLWFYVLLLMFLKPDIAECQILWDNFEYPAGTLLTSNGWTAFSSGGVNPIQVVPGSLSYNGYFSSGYGNSVQLTSAGGEDVGINFLMCNSGSIYCAFLVKVFNVSPKGEFFFHFGTSTSGTDVRGRVFVKAVNGGITFGISKSNRPALYSSSVYPIDSVYLVVLKYTFIPGNSTDDLVNLFINPPLSFTEPMPDLITGSGENDATNNISNIALRQGDAGDAPSIIIDGLRVGTSWEETPLPVKLNYFNFSVNKSDVLLKWETSFEINNSGFEVQRKFLSVNSDWESISFINGHGTVWNNSVYTFNNRVSRSGSYNYRLKQIDYNGSFEYFELNNIVTISAPGNFVLNQNYPNPFNPVTKIKFSLPEQSGFSSQCGAVNVCLKIFDLSGREVASLIPPIVGGVEGYSPGTYETEWNASGYSSGMYFYKLTVMSEGKLLYTDTKKLILIK